MGRRAHVIRGPPFGDGHFGEDSNFGTILTFVATVLDHLSQLSKVLQTMKELTVVDLAIYAPQINR